MKRILFLLMMSCFILSAQAQHTITVKHTYYTMQYDTIQYAEIMGYYVQTKAHSLISLDKTKKIGRTGSVASFKQDPLISPKYQVACDSEYAKYNKLHQADGKKRDKGHVNPYTAFDFDEVAAKESMYYTNTCPQVSYFNEHQWKAIEQYVLKIVPLKYGDVQVYTGVLIDKKMMKDVPEPNYYWKVIVYNIDGKPFAEGWLGPNNETNTSTDPNAIKKPVSDIVTAIHHYYPKLQLPFATIK